MISNEENPEDALQYFFEHVEEIELNGKFEDALKSIEKVPYKKVNKLVESLIDTIVSDKPDVKAFYRQVWENVTNDALFKDEDRKICAFLCIWMNIKIPYFKLDSGITMAEEEFLDIVQCRKKDIQKIIYIINSEFSQKTERSSLIIDILSNCDTDKEKAVVLSQAFSALEQRTLNMIVRKMMDFPKMKSAEGNDLT